jgi:hypothetical protein
MWQGVVLYMLLVMLWVASSLISSQGFCGGVNRGVGNIAAYAMRVA